MYSLYIVFVYVSIRYALREWGVTFGTKNLNILLSIGSDGG